MYRIDDATATNALPTPEATGAEGYFTEGSPTAGQAATLVRASWLNMIQEELRAIVVAGGLTPSKTVFNQIVTAIKTLIGVPVRTVKRQIFTASGTYTPSAGLIYADVEIVGGGASGGGSTGGTSTGSAGSGGGAGGYSKKIFTAAQIGASVVVTIGAGGAAQAAGANGANGGATTFLTLAANSGGGGFAAPASATVGSGANTSTGGLPAGGDINIQGQSSGLGIGFGAGGGVGGAGGSSQYGSGGPQAFPTGGGGNPGVGYGVGGSGSASTTVSYAGAKGNSGICIITEYCNQ